MICHTTIITGDVKFSELTKPIHQNNPYQSIKSPVENQVENQLIFKLRANFYPIRKFITH
jgi:hypothetical protein